MKLLLVKCGICDNWHLPTMHCGVCGAYSVPRILARSTYINCNGVEMVRAIPRSLHGVIERVVAIAKRGE